MNDYNPSGKNGSGEQDDEDILVAEDGGEILTDGGELEEPTTDEPENDLEFTAAIETFATPEDVSVEVGVAVDDIVKVAFHSERIQGVFFLQPAQIENLVAQLTTAKTELEEDDAEA